MESNERDRLKNLKELEKKMKKKSLRQSKLVRIFTVILWSLLIVAVIYLIMLYSGIINNAEDKFGEEFNLVYEAVKNENNKKQQNPFYNYIGLNAEEKEKIYVDQYNKVKQIVPDINVNEDYYIIDNTNANQIGINREVAGIYLINYDYELVFNLKPYIDKEKEIYILPEILSKYNESKDVDVSGANEPLLLEGMTPVKYNSELSKWEITTKDDKQWYNYNKKIWANVILSDYKDDISEASMFVWIPRYAYMISDKNYNTSNEGIIAIKFLTGNTNFDKNGNEIGNNTNSSKDYVVHPAFNCNSELTGIWVSKFEASSLEYGKDGNNYGGNNDLSLTYKSVANRYSWLNLQMNTSYLVSKNIINNSMYGLNNEQIDSHLMKNVEWGSIAYLAQSRYGRNNNKITINNYNEKGKFKTGYGSVSINTVESGSDSSITTLWDTKSGSKASTTGNVYGVYDLVGGAIERTAAYLNNESISIKSEALALYQAENQYKDLYSVSKQDERSQNYLLSNRNYGDAIFETSGSGINDNNSWYKSFSFMPTGNYPFFYRGGSAKDEKKAGIFYFSGSSGGQYEYAGFRAVLTNK